MMIRNMKRLFVIYILTTGIQATTYDTLEQHGPLTKRNTGIRPTTLDSSMIEKAPILRRAIQQLFPTYLKRRGNICGKGTQSSPRKKERSPSAAGASQSSSMNPSRPAMDMGHSPRGTTFAAVTSTSKTPKSDRRKSIYVGSSAMEGLSSRGSIDPPPSTSRRNQAPELHAKISAQGSSANPKVSFLNWIPGRKSQGSDQSVLGSADSQAQFLTRPPLRTSSLREMPAMRQMGGIVPRLGSEPMMGGNHPRPEYDSGSALSVLE